MTNERFFRMLSVAILGLLAIAIVPDSRATDAQFVATAESVEALPIEVSVIREINEINAGHFKATSLDEIRNDAFVIASPILTTTISQIDPNL